MRETILGGFETVAKLSHGEERLAFLITRSRIVLASEAKLGRVSMALSQLLGRMASGAERSGYKKGKLERLVDMSPDEVLSLNSGNFEIGYSSIVVVRVEPEDRDHVRVTVVTDRDKFLFEASRTAVNGVRELMGSVLGQKLEFRT